ncbi:MAG: hypothetical protein R2875_16430 [Desulfobacterales bacterium]
MKTFARLNRLPKYVFAAVNQIKMDARHAGEDIVDLGMGNPDLGTPQHIVDKLIGSGAETPKTTDIQPPWGSGSSGWPLERLVQAQRI